MNLKNNKGFGVADTIIAIGIFIIFTGFIISISYNIYLQSNYIKRNEQATSYIVEAFEHAQGLLFKNVDTDTIVRFINSKGENVHAIAGQYNEENAEKLAAYTIFVNVTDVNVTADSKTYIKQIDITVMYELGRKVKTVNMKTLINK